MSKRWWTIALVLAATLPALAGFGAVYVIARSADNAAEAERQQIAQATATPASSSNPLSQGEMIKFVFKREPEAVGEIAFVDGTGAPKTLADFKGRVVLLNVWATWCVPCRKEMPALDRLQKELGSDKFEVVALSVDRGGIEASRKFLDSIGVSSLKLYVDPTAKMSSPLKIIGMPTTLLINAEGKEVGRLTGEAIWDSDDAKKLIKAVAG
jgi:thiol-disulfide isomerase/thioredoxin